MLSTISIFCTLLLQENVGFLTSSRVEINEKTNLPTISPFVIDGNTHAPPVIMLLVSLPL
jgi:hypothetical protein